MKKLQLVVFILLGSLALAETMLRVFFKPSPPPPLFDVATMPSVRAEPWFGAWEKEHAHMTRRFRAYELYALEAFDGEHLGVTPDGYRRTINPETLPAGARRVGLFGGSTMWGGLARDSHTIASELSASLNHTGFPTHVTNFGQVGFVFSQEIHQALRVLYTGEAPETFVFMDGVCDVLAALANFVNGVAEPAGKPWEYDKYAYLFQLGKTGEVSWLDIAKKSMLVRRVWKIGEKRGWVEADDKNRRVTPTAADKQRLVRTVSDHYLQAVKTASAAFKGAGVRPIFVLQPAIFDKTPLSEEEKDALEKNRHWQEYVVDTYASIREGARDLPDSVEFWDFSQIFQNHPETLYADIMHYSEAGNRVIARAMAERLRAKTPTGKDSLL